ncbi:MAG TPA: hypothetical protein VGP46_11320, partial [Acidimicrobiales bacterium]|nr:hypothetical protein [Acidimicrobiales bacterium]
YWLVSSTGQIQAHGSSPALKAPRTTASVVSAVADLDGRGMWLLESNGSLVATGSATFEGAPGTSLIGEPVAIGN